MKIEGNIELNLLFCSVGVTMEKLPGKNTGTNGGIRGKRRWKCEYETVN